MFLVTVQTCSRILFKIAYLLITDTIFPIENSYESVLGSYSGYAFWKAQLGKSSIK